MVYLDKSKLKKSNDNIGMKKHELVEGNYYLFTTEEGEKIIQINTYGSKQRKIKNKVSQVFQANKEMMEILLGNFDSNFVGNPINKHHNTIYYGAPGTGKSYLLEEDRKKYFGKNYERVTFHPSYTYAQFVGRYKPRSKKVQAGSEDKKEISYEYVPGPFLRVLTKALKSIKDGGEIENYVLIIEEINRANPAAVFGDTFQLLDRKDGESEYEISVNEDMKDYLRDKLEEEYETIKIPANMYIWATMNSADQGVYPMDTAFKRRWNFEYIDIDHAEAENDAVIKLKNGNYIKWNELRHKINKQLSRIRNVSEDKQIGPFFLNKYDLAEENFDSSFKNKLLMYLYEDVLKNKKANFFNESVDIGTFSELLDAYDKIGMGIFKFYIEEKDELKQTVDPKEAVSDSEN